MPRVTLLIGSVAFRVVAAPAMVRFPLNVDETAHYTGTAVSGTFSKAVIDETVTVKTGGTTNVESYQYVIDRRSMQMVADPHMVAFGDSNATMHAAGAYRVNFPMGTNAKGSYRAYIPEEDAFRQLVLVEGAHAHPDARIKVLDFASKRNGPVAPYHLAHLKKMGLPMQVTAAKLAPVLLAEGIDVHTRQQGIAVQPDLSGAAVLQPLFDRYASIPSVKALSSGLARLAKSPPLGSPAQAATIPTESVTTERVPALASSSRSSGEV